MGSLTETQARALAAFYAETCGWGFHGVMTLLQQCSDNRDEPRSIALALARISLDERMDGPGILPQHGQHWRDTPTGSRPEKPKCQTHMKPHPCHDCQADPRMKPLDDPKAWRAQVDAEIRKNRDARQAAIDEQNARREAARHEAAQRTARQREAARQELHPKDKP